MIATKTSFVEREFDRLEGVLRGTKMGGPFYKQVYAARQALAWALDPDGFMSPYMLLTEMPTANGLQRTSRGPVRMEREYPVEPDRK